MFRLSSVAYATTLLLITKLFLVVFQFSLPEAMTAGMALTIVLYMIVSWSYLSYAFNRLCNSFDSKMAEGDTVGRLIVMSLFLSWIPALLVVTYQGTMILQTAPEIAYGYIIVLIFIANCKTSLYEEYLAWDERRRLTGLKPLG